MKSDEPRWDFFTNHAHVIFYLQANPGQPLRQVAMAIGITERAVQRIVAELEEGGYLERTKVGRQNRYVINGDAPLRHALEAHHSLQDLLEWLEPVDTDPEALEDLKALENWKVGEHGSEV